MPTEFLAGHQRVLRIGSGPLRFAIDRDALQASGVVAHRTLVVRSDRHLVPLRVGVLDTGVVASHDAERLPAPAVAHDVARLIAFCPLPIGAYHLLAGHHYGASDAPRDRLDPRAASRGGSPH